MRAIVLAYHDIGCNGIEALLDHGFEIAGVLTHADDPNETQWFRSVAELAAKRGLPVFAPKDPNHPLWLKRIRELAPDVLFSFYYRAMLSDEVLAIPKHGSFNLHGSLLPAYRGRAPANWASWGSRSPCCATASGRSCRHVCGCARWPTTTSRSVPSK